MKSEDVTSHFPSSCVVRMFWSRSMFSSPLYLSHYRAMRCQGLYVGNGDGQCVSGCVAKMSYVYVRNELVHRMAWFKNTSAKFF